MSILDTIKKYRQMTTPEAQIDPALLAEREKIQKRLQDESKAPIALTPEQIGAIKARQLKAPAKEKSLLQKIAANRISAAAKAAESPLMQPLYSIYEASESPIAVKGSEAVLSGALAFADKATLGIVSSPYLMGDDYNRAFQEAKEKSQVGKMVGELGGMLIGYGAMGKVVGKIGLKGLLGVGARGGGTELIYGTMQKRSAKDIAIDTGTAAVSFIAGGALQGYVGGLLGKVASSPTIKNTYLKAFANAINKSPKAQAFIASQLFNVGQMTAQEASAFAFTGKSNYQNEDGSFNYLQFAQDMAINTLFDIFQGSGASRRNEAQTHFDAAKKSLDLADAATNPKSKQELMNRAKSELDALVELSPVEEVKTSVEAAKAAIDENAETPVVETSRKEIPNAQEKVQAQEEVVAPNETVHSADTTSIPTEESAPRAQYRPNYKSKEAKRLVKTPEDKATVEDFIAQHETKSVAELDSVSSSLLAEMSKADSKTMRKINLQLFALQSLADKMGAKNVSRVLKNVFGKELGNLTPETIAVLEKRDSSEEYTPLVVQYEKKKNEPVWEAGKKKLETQDGINDIMEKSASDEIMSPEDVSATMQLGMEYLRSGDETKIVIGSEILSRLSRKESRMGQAIQILSKAYAEMGILNSVKKEFTDATPAMKQREHRKGTEALKKKAQDTAKEVVDAMASDMDKAWKKYESEHKGKITAEERQAWIENYRKEHANDRFEKAQDNTIPPSERLADALDKFARAKYEQGPEQQKPLVDLASELLRMVKENNPELGKKIPSKPDPIAQLDYLVKNRKEYGKTLDDAFEMIESAYRRDPAKYPVEFMAEVHKYLNDTATIRTQRYDEVIRTVLKETGLTMKDLITDWMTKGQPKLQTFQDYVQEHTSLGTEDAQYLQTELQKRLDVIKEERRSKILKDMFRESKGSTRRSLEDRFMEAIGLNVATDAQYGSMWADEMGIPNFTPQMAADIQTTMQKYFEIDPDMIYDTGKTEKGKVYTAFRSTFGSQYDGASQAPGWYLRQQMYDSLMERISSHVPMELLDKYFAFSYSSMLSGINSWGKNPLSNLMMTGMSRIADLPNAAIQRVFVKEPNRTVTPRSYLGYFDPALQKTISDVYERRALPQIKNEGLEAGIARVLKRNQKIFKSETLDTINKLPFKAMEYGDIPFLRNHFEDALMKYMSAHNTKEVTDAAYAHAYGIALENTFRDISAINHWLNSAKNLDTMMPEIRRLKKDIVNAKTDAEAQILNQQLNKITRGAELMKFGKQMVLPFVNTLTNIASRMIEYSPYGAVTTIGNAIHAAKNKSFSGAELSRDISKVITGTILGSGAGAILSILGDATGAFSINGATPTDAQEKKRWKAEGRMPYTIGIKMADGSIKYISLDWAAPAVASFFMGSTIKNHLQEKGYTVKDILDAGVAGIDVLWQMSFVQGLNNLMGGYGSPTTKIVDVAMKYPFQAFPNWLAKINSVIDDTVRQYPQDSKDFIQGFINNFMRRLPGASVNLQPKLDAWGNDIKVGQLNPKLGAFGRALNAYLAPYKVYNGNDSNELTEVVRLYRAARDAGASNSGDVLPDFSGISIPLADKTMGDLTDAEATQMNRVAGKYARERIAREMSLKEWNALPDYSADGGSKFATIVAIYNQARAEAVADMEKTRGIESKGGAENPVLAVTVNGKKTEYKLSYSKYQEYKSLVADYKAQGYTNSESAARSKILIDMGYKVPVVKPAKAYKTITPTPNLVDTTGG